MNTKNSTLPDIPIPDTYLGNWRKRHGWSFDFAAQLLDLTQDRYYIYENEILPVPPIVIAASTGAILVHALQEAHCKKGFFLRTNFGAGWTGTESFIEINLKTGLRVDEVNEDVIEGLRRYLVGIGGVRKPTIDRNFYTIDISKKKPIQENKNTEKNSEINTLGLIILIILIGAILRSLEKYF